MCSSVNISSAKYLPCLNVTDVAIVIIVTSAEMLVSPSARRLQPTATVNLRRLSTS